MSLSKVRIIYLCNAIDQNTKEERKVVFDSPAATNKVFGLAKALQTQGLDIQIVSFGKGKQTGSGNKYPAQSKIVFGIPVHYAAFWQIPIITHIVGTFSLASLVRYLTKGFSGRVIVIAYNRLWQYLPSLIYAKCNKVENYLDLEDGPLPSKHILLRLKDIFSKQLFSLLCNSGSIIVARNIANQVRSGHIFICYGTTEIQQRDANIWSHHPIKILFGGTLVSETGVQLLIDTVTWLEFHNPELKKKISFTVTGQGSLAANLQHFAEISGKDWIKFLGSIDRNSYTKELNTAHIGLNLRLASSEMGKTTFPSKILEYASHGLTIVSTRVSDVPDLLDNDTAILLDEETPQHLASIFTKIGEGFYDLQSLGKKGQEKINSVCSTEVVGKNLKQFLLKESDR